MRTLTALALALVLALCPLSSCAEPVPRIGVLAYNASDAFISGVTASIERAADGIAELLYRDSENSQILQNEQVKSLLEAGVDALIVNAVDRTCAVYLIRMTAPYGVPIVFINREPLLEDLLLYDRAYYVGNKPEESGYMSGQVIAQHFLEHSEADRDGDGVLQYVMLKGEPGHQDAELRTVWSVRALKDAGVKTEKLQEVTALWERSIAQEKMAGLIASYGDRIECVIANNDEMALGAIEALKAAGQFTSGRFMPVVGVDATSAARDALNDGTLLGTVLNDAEAQGDAALRLAMLLAENQSINSDRFPYVIDRCKYVWIPSQIVTQ